jgi:hypothetical protein
MRLAFSLLIFCVLLSFLPGCDRHGTPAEQQETVSTDSIKDGSLTSMKGWELYSWQQQYEWYFALVIGTNRVKTFEEISSDTVAAAGVEALRVKLRQLAENQSVFWTAHRVPNTIMPPTEIIDQVKAYCDSCGLSLSIVP